MVLRVLYTRDELIAASAELVFMATRNELLSKLRLTGISYI